MNSVFLFLSYILINILNTKLKKFLICLTFSFKNVPLNLMQI